MRPWRPWKAQQGFQGIVLEFEVNSERDGEFHSVTRKKIYIKTLAMPVKTKSVSFFKPIFYFFAKTSFRLF